MKTLFFLLLPLSAAAQQPQPRVMPPDEIRPDERYEYIRPLSFSTDPYTGQCACMACVMVMSTGEYVQVRMSCDDCNQTTIGEVIEMNVVPSNTNQ